MKRKPNNRVAFGIYDSQDQMETALDSFRNRGFRNTDISVLMPQRGDTQTFAHEKATKAPEGAAVGTSTGAVIGGTLGWLVGAGLIATIPAFGPLVAAGPIMASLSGIAVGGAVGGITGALIGLGMPEYEAKRYESAIKEGGILVSIHCDDRDWAHKASRALEDSGAHDVSCGTEEGSPELEKPLPHQDDVSLRNTY